MENKDIKMSDLKHAPNGWLLGPSNTGSVVQYIVSQCFRHMDINFLVHFFLVSLASNNYIPIFEQCMNILSDCVVM